MESKDETFVILEQYKIYSDAKEKFIERQFVTNRFYLVLNLVILITLQIISTITPQLYPLIVLALIGVGISLMWWMNIDSYQLLIKVKYSGVLEYLETKLPEQPYKKEYNDYTQLKKKNNLIVFGDFQKFLALSIACIYIFVTTKSVANLIRYSFM